MTPVDDESFWAAVAIGIAAITDEERAARIHDDTLTDDLADSADDRLSATDAW